MDGKLTISIIFLISTILMIYLIFRRPFLYIRLGIRKIRIETYFIGVLLGPLLIIVFGILNYDQIIGGLQGNGKLNPFGILILFLSMVFISIYLDITGFFEYCARLALQFSGANGKRMFFSFYATISILTIFTSNDIIILTFTPFIYYFSKNAGIDPKPYLVAEFFAANTWSMMLYIGNPTNIVLASAYHLRFDTYFFWMFVPALTAGFLNMGLLYLLFRKKINQPIQYLEKTHKPSAAITDKTGAVLGLIILISCIVALSIAPYFDLDMWQVSIFFALLLFLILIVRDSLSMMHHHIKERMGELTTTVKKIPFSIVPFVLSLFIIVEALRIYGVTTDIGIFFSDLAGTSTTNHIFVYGFSSAFSANIINNIPMTVAFVPITGIVPEMHQFAAVLATTIGSNLGANITPIGALAGLMWMSILREKEVRLSFKEFLTYGLVITPITLGGCLGVLALEFFIVQ
ncbi:MAG: ArsB/NhaD family transporter [Candidatus Thermoplasmatota archaeon]